MIEPDAENGYGPNSPERNLMISGWRLTPWSAISEIVGGVSADVPAIQSFAFWGSEGAPLTVQPSKTLLSRSNDVEPWPPGPTTSSTSTPAYWNRSSLACVSDTSTDLPRHADRSTTQFSYPSLLPLADHQAPVVPVGAHEKSSKSSVT